MATAAETFEQWLAQARIPEPRLTPEQRSVLLAAFRFRQQQGTDYYSTRLLSHFLLHSGCGLKVAQLARLVAISRPTASRQQGQSSKEAVQQAHHRLDGRPYGKLLPRYAGPIAQFLLTHVEATRADLIDFIGRTFDVRVSRVAVYKFLKKYGLDRVSGPDPATMPATPRAAAAPPRPPDGGPAATPAAASAPPFCSDARTMPARS
jgi:hypothetical protein